MNKSKLVKIEVLQKNQKVEGAWYNDFIGEKFLAKDMGNVYLINSDSLKKVLDRYVLCAMIPKEYAEIEGQEIRDKNIETFPLVPRHIKNIIEVRKFTVTKDITRTVGRNGETETIKAEGDVYEEMYDKPNVIVKMEDGKIAGVIKLKELNNNTILLTSFKCDETISAKESLYFTQRKKEIEKQYARKRKKVEQLNDEIGNLEYMLDINPED